MVAQFCVQLLEEYINLVRFYETLMLILCVLLLAFSALATCGNLFAICALWKSSSIPATLKKLFLSLAVSDLVVGIFAQLMLGIVLAVMLEMAASESYNYDVYCPSTLPTVYFSIFFLACASFLNVTAIAVDRLLALSLHLRYQEFVTSKRVLVVLVFVWLTSGFAAYIFISLPNGNGKVSNIIEFIGFLVTTVAYFRIYKIARYHHNQIQSQCQLQNGQVVEVLREKKSTVNVLIVYIIFLSCYFPHFCCTILYVVYYKDNPPASLMAAHKASQFLILLNSSLNPLIYCWRYREIREIMKSTAKKVICIT